MARRRYLGKPGKLVELEQQRAQLGKPLAPISFAYSRSASAAAVAHDSHGRTAASRQDDSARAQIIRVGAALDVSEPLEFPELIVQRRFTF